MAKEEYIVKVTITAKKMQVPQNFPEYAENKLNSKHSKFFGDEAEAKITMSEYKNQIILELTVKYNNMIYRSERQAADKNIALDSVIDIIIRQIRKNKTKIEKRLKDTAFKEAYSDTVEEQVDYEVIKAVQMLCINVMTVIMQCLNLQLNKKQGVGFNRRFLF